MRAVLTFRWLLGAKSQDIVHKPQILKTKERCCPQCSLPENVSIRQRVYIYIRTMHVRSVRAHELCESRGGRPGLPVPNSPYGLCGRKATLIELEQFTDQTQKEKVNV